MQGYDLLRISTVNDQRAYASRNDGLPLVGEQRPTAIGIVMSQSIVLRLGLHVVAPCRTALNNYTIVQGAGWLRYQGKVMRGGPYAGRLDTRLGGAVLLFSDQIGAMVHTRCSRVTIQTIR